MSNRIEEIKRAKDGLDVLTDILRYAEGGDEIDPDDIERLKWFGLFHRRQTPGYFMMRLRIANGVLSGSQARVLGDLVNRYGRGAADLTTRQGLQFRWLRIQDVPAIFEALDGAGISYMQTGMDNVRNVTGCPMAGLDAREVLDASPVAAAIEAAIVGLREFSNLPRKLNISVSGCRFDCAMSKTNDIGLTPATLAGAAGFNVQVGGALGGKQPMFARALDVFVTPEQAPALCAAVLSVFRDLGSRENRQQARLKWLIDAWGIERFREAVEGYAGPLARAGRDEVLAWGNDHVGVQSQTQPGLFTVGLLVPVGRISGDDLVEAGRLAESYGSDEIRLTNDQNLLIVNVPETRLDGLMREPLLRRFSPNPPAWLRHTVSCTGSDYCHYALIDTKGSALRLAAAMQEIAPDAQPMRVHWSGCPHACGQHGVADIGLLASRVRIGDEIVDAADVYLGGSPGPQPRLGERVLEGVPLGELPSRLLSLLPAGALRIAAEAAL
ncbi:MAG TPA: ferredoxin--nitrite reductase [Dehalococcoidia bacterium]|nr:ferredoxin--nitrite reductase [Dehalococcoidia bacterium]